MPTPQEPDFPPGHPARFDYDPASPAAQEWARQHIHPKGERDFPVDHPKASDTPGNKNAVAALPGVDPDRPDYEAFTGRSPEQAKAAREVYQALSETAQESPVALPVSAPAAAPDANKQRVKAYGPEGPYAVYCPACKGLHTFDSRWKFNGSLELPTFDRAMLVNENDPQRRCHCAVTNGQIQYFADSAHALRGTTVELPAVETAGDTIHA